MNSKSLHFLQVYIWCREEKEREGGRREREREKGETGVEKKGRRE